MRTPSSSIRAAAHGVGRPWASLLGTGWLAVMTATAAPTVTSFTPTVGEIGRQVTVNGTGFSAATRVQFNNQAADFQVQSATRLLATVPPGAVVGPIQVSDASGTGSSGATVFLPAPRLTAVVPGRGATNTTVVLEGANFAQVTAVWCGGRSAIFAVPASDQLRLVVPPGATNAPIGVRTAAGEVWTTEDFIVTGRAPIVDGFSPAFGAPGTAVVVDGANFTNLTGVKFGTANATIFNAPTPARINTVVPAGATTGKITVTTGGGTGVSTGDFRVALEPVITNFYPKLIPAKLAGSTTITLEGVNFTVLTDVVGVGFNGKNATSLSMAVPGQLRAGVPNGVTTGPITVTNRLGGVTRVGATSEPLVVTQAPVIDWFTPEVGRVGVDEVTLWGNNLSNGPTVLRFNGTPAPFTVRYAAPEGIAARVPTGATTGPLSLSNAFGVFVTTTNFTVVGDRPAITAFTPGFGPRGTSILIEGRSFPTNVTVAFGGVQDPTAFGSSPSQILATVPAGAVTGPITVATSGGISTSTVAFHVAPRLLTISPVQGPAATPVTLTGLNLTNATHVEFGGVPAEFTVVDNTRITAVVPDEGRTGPLRVTTPGGVVLSLEDFRVLPRITSVSPPLGPNLWPVTLTGNGFRDVSAVTFNFAPAPFTNISSTEIRTAVPWNALTGRIRVTTPDGTATNATDFLVTRSSDLRLTLTASTQDALPSERVTFSLLVTNRGLSPVTQTILTNALPSGLALVAATPSQGSFTETNGLVRCDLGTLLNGASATLTVEAQVLADGLWTNRASVWPQEGDQNVGDNTATAVVRAISEASLTLETRPGPGTNQLVIAWPATALPLVLESANQLPPTNAWQLVPVGGVVGGSYAVTNTTTQGQRYYRLRLP